MCRFAAFIGNDPLPLSSALFDPPHSLQRQAYAPKLLLRGHVNVDGVGAAWWTDEDATPATYVTTSNPWADPNLYALAKRTRSSRFVAAVRSATPGIPHGAAHVQPFVSDRLVGVHNGWIGGFRGPIGQDLISSLPPESFTELTALNDSQVLFRHAAGFWRELGDVAKALRSAIEHVEGALGRHREAATLNVALSDGISVAATRHSRDFDCNSLFFSSQEAGNWLASEPFEDGAEWTEIPVQSLVTMTPASVEVEPL